MRYKTEDDIISINKKKDNNINMNMNINMKNKNMERKDNTNLKERKASHNDKKLMLN